MQSPNPASAAHSLGPVGLLLRHWRSARGMSQLDLAMQSGFSARHVSFIETGRTRPSRQALLVLAETLDVPLRERNRLLEAGGYAQVYRQTPLEAVVLDRYSNCLMGNSASGQLISAVEDPSLITEHTNYLRLALHPRGMRHCIVNWDDVARHLIRRAEQELGRLRDAPTATALLAELREYDGPLQPPPAALTAADLLLPVHIRRNGHELRMFSTIMTLGTAQDVTLQELRIETFFPADEASEQTWRALAAAAVT